MTATAEPLADVDANRMPAASHPSVRPRSGRRWMKWLLALAGLLVLAVCGAALWVAWGLPRIDLSQPPGGRPLIVLEAADGTPISQSGGSYAGPVTREELPEHLVEAVLAIEDRRFYDHIGVDAFGIVRAALRNFRAGAIVQGGSTITQQLAKVLFLSPEQTMRRKLQEAVIATVLDTRLSKDEILTKYLDSVYFGAGATGVSAAAQTYFDKTVRDLNLAESAMLAGLLRAPSRLNPIAHLDDARARAAVVLQAMVDAGFITREDAIPAALNAAAPVRRAAVAQTGSWFGDWISANATSAMGPLAGSARIRTTLQPAIQAAAEQIVRDALDRAGAQGNVGQAALVAMTLDGAVVAMVGGRSYGESQFNRAVDAKRQPGSAFKTFVYLAALRAGHDPQDIILDEPIEVGNWKPQNFDGRFHGEVTLEQAFARSLNAATVQLAQDVGIENVIDTARDLGLDADLPSNPAISLGTAEVSLLDLTGAYASIAAGQTPVQPWGIAGVSENAEAEPALFQRNLDQTQPLRQRDAILSLLTSVVREGTGRKAALEGFSAGKTGTSQENRDAWFVGFTDTMVAGVWVGNDDNSPMRDVTGGGLPAEIWRGFVVAAGGGAPAESTQEDQPAAEADAVAAERREEPDAEAIGTEEPPRVITRRRHSEPQSQAVERQAEPDRRASQRQAAPDEEATRPRVQPEQRRAQRQRLREDRVARRRAQVEQRAARRRDRLEQQRARQGEPEPRVERGIEELAPVIRREAAPQRRVILREQPAPERRVIRRRDNGDRSAEEGPSILLNGQGLP